MGIRDLKRKYPSKLLPSYFNNWRSLAIKNIREVCKFYNNKDMIFKELVDKDISVLSESLKNFPSSIIRLTRQMCDCDEDCTMKSLKYVNFGGCSLYNFENTDVYSKLYLDKKVVDKELVDSNYVIDTEYLKEDIRFYFNEANKGNTYFRDLLKCKVYEVKDFCKTKECYDEFCKEECPNEICKSKEDLCKLPAFPLKNNNRQLSYVNDRATREIRDFPSRSSMTAVPIVSLSLLSFCFLENSSFKGKMMIGLALLASIWLYIDF